MEDPRARLDARDADVLIVGAGPVGLTLALGLARQGARCRIVDRDAGPSRTSRASELHARTLEVLDAMGAAGDMMAAGLPLRMVTFVSRGRRVAQLATAGIDSSFPARLALPQSDTERIWESHLASMAVAVERERELLDFLDDGAGVTATFRDARGERTSGDRTGQEGRVFYGSASRMGGASTPSRPTPRGRRRGSEGAGGRHAKGDSGTITAMAELAETLDATAGLLAEVTRDPESAAASAAVERIADDIQRFLRSKEAQLFVFMVAMHRGPSTLPLVPKVARLYGDFHAALSIGFQLYELGRPVGWTNDLALAMAYLSGWLNAIGVRPPPLALRNLPVPPMVAIRQDEPESVDVIMTPARYPQLARYIALALQRARVTQMEDGRWFAELGDDFRGVWADGASRDESLAALADVLHEWLVIKVGHGDEDLPVLEHLDPRALIPVT